MAKHRFPYVILREQADGSFRPRFVPGPRERALGFRGEDLRHDGRWLTLDEVRTWSAQRAASIEAARRAPAGSKRAREVLPRARRSVGELLEDWLASPEVTALRSATRRGYRSQVDAILWRPQSAEDRKMKRPRQREPFSLAPVGAIGAPELHAFFRHARTARGLHMARASIRVISAAWTWGRISTAWRLGANPASRLRLETPPGRIVIWTDAEIRAFVAAADALGRPSIGDAVILGLYSGQRQGDRLSLVDGGLSDGRRQFRQAKTGALVAIPEAPALRERLAAARARTAAIALARGQGADERPAEIIISEETGRPYAGGNYAHVFARVRAQAAAGIVDAAATAAAAAAGRNEPVWRLAPCPSLAGKRDQDLRDTAVTWLARAGASLPEIAAVTGHSLASIHGVLKHYLAITPELADAAIGKLLAWMEREGLAV